MVAFRAGFYHLIVIFLAVVPLLTAFNLTTKKG